MERYKDREWLRKKYQDEGLTRAEIGEICGVTTIGYWLSKLDIETRDPGYSAEGKYTDEDWLREQYIDKRRALNDIADECNVSAETIRRWADRHNIDTRSASEATKVEWEGADERRQMNSENCLDWFGDKAHQNSYFSRPEVIEELKERTGSDNPNWKGGYDSDYASHTEWRRIKPKVRERDNFECQVCGITETEADNTLHVHHIKPVREFDTAEDAHFIENLLTVCVSCHGKIEGMDKDTLEEV